MGRSVVAPSSLGGDNVGGEEGRITPAIRFPRPHPRCTRKDGGTSPPSPPEYFGGVGEHPSRRTPAHRPCSAAGGEPGEDEVQEEGR